MNDLAWTTPLWESPSLTQSWGRPVFLKMEALQPVGSFKIRGIGLFCQNAVREGARHFVCASGGNAGLAVAYAARKLGVEATIFVPRTTPEPARKSLRQEGATVFEAGTSWDDTQAEATAFAAKELATTVHPFDHPTLWRGHAGLIVEASEQGPRPGHIVCSVGGGGLLCGVLEGLDRVGWTDVQVTAAETTGAASLAAALEVGELVQLERIESIATTLGARRVATEALARAQRYDVVSEIVTDREAVTACVDFANQHRVLVEPACGAAIAAAAKVAARTTSTDPILVIVCGGAGATLELLSRWVATVEESS